MTILLLFTPQINAATGFRYYGKVINEDGTPIVGAHIDIYDETKYLSGTGPGLYLKTIQTPEDGTFSFYLDYGRYKLVISKSGYTTETLSLPGYIVLDIGIGNVTLRRNISFSISTPSIVTPSGEGRTTQLVIENRGAVEELVTLRCLAPASWGVRVRDETGEVLAVSLTPGSTRILNLDVDVPLNATSGVVEVTALGSVNVRTTLTVVVHGVSQQIIGCEYPSKQRAVGGQVDYVLLVTNTFTTPRVVTFTQGGLPDDWEFSLLNNKEERITSISLASGAEAEITFHIAIPQNATDGEYEPFVEAVIDGLSSKMSLKLSVERNIVKLDMVTMYPVQQIEQGKVASFPIILENPGESDEVIELSTEFLPKGWSAAYTNDVGAIIRSILLQAGRSQTVRLVLTPPYDVGPNNYHVRAEATSPTLYGNLTLTVGIVGKTDMRITMGNLFGQVTVGETKEFEVKMSNTGFTQLTFPRLEAEPSVSSLAVECSPIDTVALKSGDEMSFRVRVTPLEGTPQGDYIVDVKGASAEMQTEPLQIRVTVQANSSQTLTVVVVIAAALASVFLVYRRFKRK